MVIVVETNRRDCCGRIQPETLQDIRIAFPAPRVLENGPLILEKA